MQLLRGGLGFRPALHVQLVENVADVGLHRGQLHVHDLRNLGVGFVRTEQMENLQFRGRQLLAGSKAGFEEMRVERRLRPRQKAGRRPPAPSSAPCTETPSGSRAAHRARAAQNGAPDLIESVRKEPAARLPPA